MSALIANPAIKSLLRGVIVWAPLWIATTVIFGGIGFFYAMFLKEDMFLASQALLVRDEANGAVMRLGRFQSQAEMKAAQETILEMTKSQQVVRNALVTVGAPKGLSNWLSWGEYPSNRLVEDTASSAIAVHAPKGTEFGVTEVIYLDVKSNTTQRALDLNKAICDALEDRLQQVRTARADGVIAELTHARSAAQNELTDSTERLNAMEREAGSDLSDLRGMTDMIAGGATSRAEFDQIKNELRQAEQAKQQLLSDRDLLIRAVDDPSAFVIAPGSFLNAQPGLKRLREGIVDGQLSGAQLTGKFTDDHPLMTASKSAQSSITNRFVNELRASISSVEADIALANQKIKRLEDQRRSSEERLSRIADSRARYSNLVAEVRSKIGILESAERALAEATATRDSSRSTSLITRLDLPVVSDEPIGPGKKTIAMLCTIAGLVFGLGIVFVITPIDAGPVFGRRQSDQGRGRRGSDFAQPQIVVAPVVAPAGAPFTAPGAATAGYAAPGYTAPTSNTAPPASNTSPSSSVDATRGSGGGSPTNAPTNSNPQTNAKASPSIVESLADGMTKVRTKLNIQSDESPSANDDGLLNPANSVSYKNLVNELSTMDIDRAFQELSKLQKMKPANRKEELSVQMKIQELKNFLSQSSKSEGISNRSINALSEEAINRIKPRTTKPN